MTDLSTYSDRPFSDPNGFQRALAVPAFDKKDAQKAAEEGAQLTPRLNDFTGAWSQPDAHETLTVEEANARYGLDGYLTFTQPEAKASADYKSRVAARSAFRDQVMSSYQLSGLDSLWQGLKGGALDPVMLPTYFVGIGELNGAKATGQAAVAMGRARLMQQGIVRGVAENTVAGLAFEGGNYGLTVAADQDYDFGAALDNLTIGAVLGAGFGAAGGHFKYGRAVKDAVGVSQTVVDAAGRYGNNPADLMRVAELESGLDPKINNPASSAGGLFQFTNSTWSAMGGGDKYDAALSADRASKMMADNASGLRGALGREPAGWELYLAHQQGLGGAKALLASPDRRAVDVLAAMKEHGKPIGEAAARERIVKNGGTADMTAGEFAGKWRDKFGTPSPVAGGVGGAGADLPEAIALLSPAERAGAYEMAVEALMDNRPVDLGPLLPTDARALRPVVEAGRDLNMTIPARSYADDVAVTTRNTEVPVRYALVELDDIITSHDDDLNLRSDYPQELQPRSRDRAGAIARNKALENDLNPRRLMSSPDAESGAPIIGRDGVAESGNGRTIALRRAARTGSDVYANYRAALDAAGYDTKGMKRPALVRVNVADMSHGERIRFTREANLDTVERMGASEQARIDAAKLPHEVLGLIDGPDFSTAGNREFVKAFIQHVAPEAVNSLATKDGAISAEAIRRIEATLLSKAYDNPQLVERLFEDSDNNLKAIGKAMKQSAPGWARLKGLAATGRVAAEVDVSRDLNAALNLVMEARDGLRPLRELVSERLDQTDIMTGDAMSEAQILFLRAMFKDTDFKVGRSVEDIARAMDSYTRQAVMISDGLDLFGNSPLGQVREAFNNSFAAIDGALTLGDKRVFSFKPEPAANIAQASMFGGDAGRAERSGPGAGVASPEKRGSGSGPAPDTAKPRVSAEGIIAADAELRELRDDVAALEAEAGIVAAKSEQPETLAEAMRAIAFCVIEGGAKP